MITYWEANERFTFDPEAGKLFYKTKTWKHNPGDIAGAKGGQGYLLVGVSGKIYKVGHIGQLHHINGKRDDDRIANLQCLTQRENLRRFQTTRINTVSGHRGVDWDDINGLWRVRLHKKFIGRYPSLKEAVEAWKIAFSLEGY